MIWFSNLDIGGIIPSLSSGRRVARYIPRARFLGTCVSLYSYPFSQFLTRHDRPCAFIHNGQNPTQKAYDNLPAAAASRVVGGMGSHWTCCTPEQFPGIERSDIFSDQEWEDLYNEARKLFHTTSTAYDDSIRHQLVKNVLLDATQDREFISMPLATRRSHRNKDYLQWTAPATILGDLANPDYDGGLFELKAQHQCTKLHRNPFTGQVEGALLKNLLTEENILVKAKKYVICAGATLTAGILFNSGFKPEGDCRALV